MTVAAFMELALYDYEAGYYARAAQRSGRAGDFFTGVDVGPLFGELLEIQIEEMAGILDLDVGRVLLDPPVAGGGPYGGPDKVRPTGDFDMVEAGAGNGRLAADVLRTARGRNTDFYHRIRLHLIEASAQARAAQADTLGDVIGRLVSSSATLPSDFEGVLVANELIDALPVHQVVMRDEGLREVYVDAAAGRLVTVEGSPSTPALADHLGRLGIVPEPGWRLEIGLRAVEWIREAARALRRGFIILIDYGHEARELYSATHAAGTLTGFSRHTMTGTESPESRPKWLERAGEQDLTAHVDFTSVRAAAEAEGLVTLGFLDQTYFLMGLLTAGQESIASDAPPFEPRQLKTLLMPGGMGSTHKVLIFGKGVGSPSLRGCSFRQRVT